ncbi:MAG: helix-turn-helix domain-containing protein [Flavobacteriales bacterium]
MSIIKTTLRERFKLFLKEKRLTQIEFSRITGYHKKNISGFLTGTVQAPKMDFIILVAQYFPELNLRWLLLGDGEMFSKQSAEPKILLELTAENSRLKDKIITLLEKG